MLLWTLALIVLTAGACGYWLHSTARQALVDRHRQTLDLLAPTLADSLTGKIHGAWSPEAQVVVDALSFDPRLAFVLVTDPQGKAVHRRTPDASAWSLYAARVRVDEASPTELAGIVSLEQGQVVVQKLPIWGRTTTPREWAQGRGATSGVRPLEGFVTLALRDPDLPNVLDRLRWTQLAVTSLVCLVAVPVVMVQVRRWTSPLQQLVRATGELAEGREPAPVADHTGDEVGLLARRFNKTAHKLSLARLELQQANAELEAKVRQRTIDLQTANALLAQEMQAKDEFLRAVSHDLGAPVRNITGLTSLMLIKHADALADDAVQKIERIAINARLQTELIDELLEMSRIRTEPRKREPVNLRELIVELVQSLDFDLTQARIDLKVQGELPVVWAQRNRMRQVFQNLLDNAVKYMRQSSEPRIIVRGEVEGGRLHISVADTGCGISAREQAHVFDVFRRTNASETSSVPGRGVGLALVKTIVETYGGRIWVKSTPGQGSTFHVTLPMSLAVDTSVTSTT